MSDPTDVAPTTENEDKTRPKPPPQPAPPPMQPNSQIDGHKTGTPPKRHHKPK